MKRERPNCAAAYQPAEERARRPGCVFTEEDLARWFDARGAIPAGANRAVAGFSAAPAATLGDVSRGARQPGASLRRIVPLVDEDAQQEALDDGCADPEEARSDDVGAGSATQPVARVPHRPSKWRRAVRRTVAAGVSGGGPYMSKLRWGSSAASTDPGSGFDRTACCEP